MEPVAVSIYMKFIDKFNRLLYSSLYDRIFKHNKIERVAIDNLVLNYTFTKNTILHIIRYSFY